MADVAEALERLANLRDRGILSEAEFEQQKAALLNPPPTPAPYVAPQPVAASNNNTTIFVVAALVTIVVLGGVALWATGVIKLPGQRPQTMAVDPQMNFSTTTPVNGTPGAAPSPIMGGPPGIPTPVASAPVSGGANPILGEWTNDGLASDDCPQSIAFSPTAVTATMLRNGTPQTETEAVSYNVQNPTLVVVTNTTAPAGASGATLTVQVQNGHLITKPGCSFH